jgi:hypothetical protein
MGANLHDSVSARHVLLNNSEVDVDSGARPLNLDMEISSHT